MVKKKLRILRTGAGSPPAPPVIDALIKEGCEVVVADADPLSFGLYHYNEAEVIPIADDPRFISEIMRICKKRKINAIIPTVDEELPHFARERDAFRKVGVEVVVSDYEAIAAFRSKINAYANFNMAGVGTPFTSRNAFAIRGKVVAKPEMGRGASGIRVFDSPTNAAAFARKTGVAYVFQEYLDGAEYTVDVLCDFEGNIITGAVRERLLAESGIAVKSRVVKEPRIWNAAMKITQTIKFRGPINIQCRKTAEGQIKFFDLNPRYAGTVALSIAAGAPMVSALVKLLRGKKVKPTGPVYKDLYMFRYWREEFVLGKALLKKHAPYVKPKPPEK